MTTCDAPPDQELLSTTYTAWITWTTQITRTTRTGDHDHAGRIPPDQ